jgi:hypothetical protein
MRWVAGGGRAVQRSWKLMHARGWGWRGQLGVWEGGGRMEGCCGHAMAMALAHGLRMHAPAQHKPNERCWKLLHALGCGCGDQLGV